MAYFQTPHGNEPIDPKELITFAEADRIRIEIGADSVREFVDANKDEVAVYDTDAKLYQIMPGEQDAAELRNLQAANPKGHWSGGPSAAQWIPDSVVTEPVGPVQGSAQAPNPDPFAGFDKLPTLSTLNVKIDKLLLHFGIQ